MFKKKGDPLNVWMSFSDLLTSALVVFMLITVALVIKTRTDVTIISETVDEVTGGFNSGLKDIEGVTVTDDGTIRFQSQSEGAGEQLFKYDSFELTSGFTSVLNQSVPHFFDVLEKVQNDSARGVTVKEIRIEGHTDSIGEDDYNLRLSQERATQTWFYIRDNILPQKPLEFQDFVKSRIVTVGFGENKLLDGNGNLILDRGFPENKALSRRVELSVLFKGFGQ